MSEISDFAKDRYAQTAMSGADYTPERVRRTVQWIPKEGKLLEIGVWDGSIVRNYRPAFEGEIYGTDVSLDAMKPALPLLKEAKPCDLNRDELPWPENTFDCVVCCEVIEHIVDTDRLLSELKRVLKPGGVLVLSTPNLASALNRFPIIFIHHSQYTKVKYNTKNKNKNKNKTKPTTPNISF